MTFKGPFQPRAFYDSVLILLGFILQRRRPWSEVLHVSPRWHLQTVQWLSPRCPGRGDSPGTQLHTQQHHGASQTPPSQAQTAFSQGYPFSETRHDSSPGLEAGCLGLRRETLWSSCAHIALGSLLCNSPVNSIDTLCVASITSFASWALSLFCNTVNGSTEESLVCPSRLLVRLKNTGKGSEFPNCRWLSSRCSGGSWTGWCWSTALSWWSGWPFGLQFLFAQFSKGSHLPVICSSSLASLLLSFLPSFPAPSAVSSALLLLLLHGSLYASWEPVPISQHLLSTPAPSHPGWWQLPCLLCPN